MLLCYLKLMMILIDVIEGRIMSRLGGMLCLVVGVLLILGCGLKEFGEEESIKVVYVINGVVLFWIIVEVGVFCVGEDLGVEVEVWMLVNGVDD